MKLLGFEITRISKALRAVPDRGGWWRIHEPFAGAWQRNQELQVGSQATYSTTYACLSRISKDIGKLPFRLMERSDFGLWNEKTSAAFSPVLRKPNHFQTPAQFREDWVTSKLMSGNTYVLLKFDARSVVSSMYVLNPHKVKPLVSDSGAVYYELQTDNLNLVPESGEPLVVPASQVIHDREACLFHPLIGVAPLQAATLATVKNVRIQESSASFFGNNAQPSGILTAPGQIGDETAKRLADYWNNNFARDNSGKVAVVGDDLKYTAMSMKSVDAQMIEQLRYSDEQICHAFGIPPFKIGIGAIPAGMKVDDLNLMYLTDALQSRIESMEDCLDLALGLGESMGVELNLEPLLRMDALKQAEVEGALVKNGIKAPNEARRRFGLPPLDGGNSVYLQQQNYSLEALAKRDRSDDPFGKGTGGEA